MVSARGAGPSGGAARINRTSSGAGSIILRFPVRGRPDFSVFGENES